MSDQDIKITLDPITHGFILAQAAYRDMDEVKFHLRVYNKAQKGEPTIDTIKTTQAAMAGIRDAAAQALEHYTRSLELLTGQGDLSAERGSGPDGEEGWNMGA